MASWNLDAGSLTPALGLSLIGVNFCFRREEAHSQAGADLAASGNLEACCAFEMLFIPVGETRLCGFLGGQVMNSWQKKGANKRRVASS